MVKNLTIILITINPNKINNFVEHHKNENLIIVDGSNIKFNNIHNFNYIKLPGFSYFDRVNIALKEVKTKFVMLAGDDEYFNLSVIDRSLSLYSTATVVIGKTLVHDGFYKNDFSEQYSNFIEGVRSLNNYSTAQRTLFTIIKEDTVYWYSAFDTMFFRKYCRYYQNDSEMANFEIAIPFFALAIPDGKIITISDTWLKRSKYTRVSKISNIKEDDINKFDFNDSIFYAYKTKIMIYKQLRGKRYRLIFALKDRIYKSIKFIFYKLKIINPNFKHEI